MAKTEIKTKPTEISVDGFIEAVADERQRADAKAIKAMMEKLSGQPAKMWGPSIIGFGSYNYKGKASSGTMCRIGFSPRKGQTVLYLIDGYEGKDAQLARLGKHKIGKSCLYIKRLSDVDGGVLEEMVKDSIGYMDANYPD